MQDIPSNFSLDNLHPLTRTLLEKRGIIGRQEVYDFLFPSYEKHIGDPFLIHGMQQAVDRIVDAFKNAEKIAIYSDYDCDGIPGGVLLRTFFEDVGHPVEISIPHRHNEGYGVHKHAVDTLQARGVTLIITVDSGIANIEEVAYAKSVGVDFIITDHHLPVTAEASNQQIANSKKGDSKKEKGSVDKKNKEMVAGTKTLVQVVPDAVAVINSKQDACTYHDDMLCGCAVAWKLSCAVLSTLRADKTAHDNSHGANSKKKVAKKGDAEESDTYNAILEKVAVLPEGYEKWYLDLVGISTIADMVPLQKENRALAHFGIKVLRKTKRPGLLHIFNEQRMKKEFIIEDDIAFTIAPRINAASRMGDPIQAHHMLYEKDKESAERYARDLEELNTQRKGEVKDVVSGISFDQLGLRPGREPAGSDVVVVGDLSWGPGILGLIAQKIIDETGKPVFVWGQGDDKTQVKGSCRSLGNVSVVDLMAHVGKTDGGGLFEGFGGHEGAGGFSLLFENVERLSDALNMAINHVAIKELGDQEVKIDATITTDDVHDVTYNAVAVLAPFGEGNPKPVFEIRSPHVLATKWFGKKGEHFEVVYATSRGGKVKAIQFFPAKDIEEKITKPHSALVHLERSYFGGRVEMRMRIVEIR